MAQPFGADSESSISSLITDTGYSDELTASDCGVLAHALGLDDAARVSDSMTDAAFDQAKASERTIPRQPSERLSETLSRHGLPKNLKPAELELFKRVPKHPLFASTDALPLRKYINKTAFLAQDAHTVIDLVKILQDSPLALLREANIGPGRLKRIVAAVHEYLGVDRIDVPAYVAAELAKAEPASTTPGTEGRSCQVDLSAVRTEDLEAELARRRR